ncbi:MAG: hypothetical protein H0X03_03050 [Nitrosopumilus sp.]|nr:hypothetical protein [Nitrosopumilus sp.]
MSKEDILSNKDWIKISIKFSGVCLSCKKKLNSGEYGYWSRIAKSILHESCYNSVFFPLSSDIKELSLNGTSESDKNRNTTLSLDNGNMTYNSINNSNSQKKKEKKIKCFICNNYIDFNNVLMLSLLKLCEQYSSNFEILYCYNCLENFGKDVYENYKKKFMTQFVDIS